MNYPKVDMPTKPGKYMWRRCPGEEWMLVLVSKWTDWDDSLRACFPSNGYPHKIDGMAGEWRIIPDPTDHQPYHINKRKILMKTWKDIGIMAIITILILLPFAPSGMFHKCPQPRCPQSSTKKVEAMTPAEALDLASDAAIEYTNKELSGGHMTTWHAPAVAKRVADAFRLKGWIVNEEPRREDTWLRFEWPANGTGVNK